jgi:hypothetical protein
MDSRKHMMETDVRARNRSDSDSSARPRFGFADRAGLRGIFRFLCIFVAYLVVVQIIGAICRPGRLASALLQFIPFCLVLAGVVYSGRTLARFDRPTLLMASCLACVFIVFGLDVTKNLTWFVGVPILGQDSRIRNDIATLAIMIAIASFPAAGYLMMKEILQAKRQLDEQVAKLQEALRHVRRLQGLLPICMYCHKIRTDEQSWQRIELYISEHSDATFTHGLCPECARKHYPEFALQQGNIVKPPPSLQPGTRE